MHERRYPAQGETIYEERLPNGLLLLAVKKPGFCRSHAMLATRYGGADRRFRLGDRWIRTPAGVAHFLEHKMFDMPNGSNVLAELSARGANPNAFTADDMTAYHITCTQDFEENLRTLLTYVSTPWYTPESVAKEQGIIAQEIRMYENAPGYMCYMDLLASLYAHHPIREGVAGTVESIAEITPELLYDCYRAFYAPGNMVLACVGDVEAERVAALARELLPSESGEPAERDYGEPEAPTPARAAHERRMAVSAPQFLLGAKLACAAPGPDRLRQQLLAELALECLAGEESPFYTELYADGLLGRDFGAELDAAAGAAALIMGGESRDPEAVREALCRRIREVAERGLDPAAFDRCRRIHYGLELAGLDQPGAYARALVRGGLEGWSPLDVFPLLEEIRPSEAAAFLCEHLAPERLALAVVRPAEA